MLIVTILVTSAVTLAIGMSIALQSLQGLSMGRAEPKSAEALSIADGCMEEALLRLARSSDYEGGTLSFGNGNCVITVNPGDSCPAI